VPLGIGAWRKSCPGGSWAGLTESDWPSAGKGRAQMAAAKGMESLCDMQGVWPPAICWKSAGPSIQTTRLAKFWLVGGVLLVKIARPKFECLK